MSDDLRLTQSINEVNATLTRMADAKEKDPKKNSADGKSKGLQEWLISQLSTNKTLSCICIAFSIWLYTSVCCFEEFGDMVQQKSSVLYVADVLLTGLGISRFLQFIGIIHYILKTPLICDIIFFISYDERSVQQQFFCANYKNSIEKLDRFNTNWVQNPTLATNNEIWIVIPKLPSHIKDTKYCQMQYDINENILTLGTDLRSYQEDKEKLQKARESVSETIYQLKEFLELAIFKIEIDTKYYERRRSIVSKKGILWEKECICKTIIASVIALLVIAPIIWHTLTLIPKIAPLYISLF